MLTCRLVGFLGPVLLGMAAAQLSVPFGARVENVCVVERLTGPLLTLKCTRGTPTPLDPRGLPGVPLVSWHLESQREQPDGAALFEYRALGDPGSSATFD